MQVYYNVMMKWARSVGEMSEFHSSCTMVSLLIT